MADMYEVRMRLRQLDVCPPHASCQAAKAAHSCMIPAYLACSVASKMPTELA